MFLIDNRPKIYTKTRLTIAALLRPLFLSLKYSLSACQYHNLANSIMIQVVPGYTGCIRVYRVSGDLRVYKGVQGVQEHTGYTRYGRGVQEYTGYTRVYRVYREGYTGCTECTK